MNPKRELLVIIGIVLAVLSASMTLAQDSGTANAEVTTVVLNGDTISVNGEGTRMEGTVLTITTAGVYSFSGTLADGQILVDTDDAGPVELILNGVDIQSAASAPIYIANAESTTIVLAEGTQNTLSDSAMYIYASADEDEPNATLFSDDTLAISGAGSLTVNANFNDGIASKDGLTLSDATITVNAVDDGIRGKDSLTIDGAMLTVVAQGDGLKADNDEDPALGTITINSGVINVSAGGDAIQAETSIAIGGGEFLLSAGGGRNAHLGEDDSAKGIKSTVGLTIDGGNFVIDSADDAIHSNDSIVINGGMFVITSGDDAVHADTSIQINGGDLDITGSYEGVESAQITINAGSVSIVASDDGVNVSDGAGGFGMGGRGGPGGAASSTNHLEINGGRVVVYADGDGMDVNGTINMTGGIVIIHGPTDSMNSAIDYDGEFNLTGGFLVAAGSSGMAQAPGMASTQNTVLVNLQTVQTAGTLFHIEANDGGDILTFAPEMAFQSVVFSSPDLLTGMTYTVTLGGSSSGSAVDGLVEMGSYEGGADYTALTISSVVTQFGGGRGPGRRR